MFQAQFFTLFALLCSVNHIYAFDVTRNDNLVVYWGQDSYGATHSDTANFQKTLSFYCQDNTIDVIPVAFLDSFVSTGGLPHFDLSNICNSNDDPVFSGSQLANCQFLASDIQACQAKGKIVTLSIGGGAGSGVFFSSSTQASSVADEIWNLFLGGNSSTRPFGNAVLDGIDLDIEGGSTQFYDTFVNRIRSHASGASKKYYVSGAPQCPFPDGFMSTVLNAVAFDMVFVQFYNNFCGLNSFPNSFTFDQWDNWVKTTAINKNTKIFIGAPASSTAAGSGFVSASTLGTIISQTRSQFSSFGGVMLWDASQAFQNNRYDAAVKSLLTSGGSAAPVNTTTSSRPSSTPPPSSTTTKPPSSTSPPSSTTAPSTGSCAGVAAWNSGTAYQGGSLVVFNGHLWTAKWWSEADQPGGPAGDWTDDGPCTTAQTAAGHATATSSSKAKTTKQASGKASSAKVTTANAASEPVKTINAGKETSVKAGDVAATNGDLSDTKASSTASESKEPNTRRLSRLFRL